MYLSVAFKILKIICLITGGLKFLVYNSGNPAFSLSAQLWIFREERLAIFQLKTNTFILLFYFVYLLKCTFDSSANGF